MKKKVLIAIGAVFLLSTLFSLFINEALIKEDKVVRSSLHAKSVLTAIEKATALRTESLEKTVEDLVSLGLKNQLSSDLEQALRNNLLSVYVFEQSSRKNLWSWEGGAKGRLKETQLAKSFGKELFEDPQGWMSLTHRSEVYPVLVFRRLLLFPEEQTEKEVVITAMVEPQFWEEFAAGITMEGGGLALVTKGGELLGASSPQVARYKRRLGAMGPWLQGSTHWATSSLNPSQLRLSSRPVAGGQLWLLGFFSLHGAQESSAFVTALFFIFIAFALIIGGLTLILVPQREREVRAKPLKVSEQDANELETSEVIHGPTDPKEDVEIQYEPLPQAALIPLQALDAPPRLNETERFQQAKRIAHEVSRELVRPITSILGHVQLGRDIKHGKNEHWAKIEKEARHAKKFIESLRAVAGEHQGVASRVPVSQVIKDQLRRLNWEIHDQKVQIETDFESKAIVLGDQYGMEEAFAALIRNAIEAQAHLPTKAVKIRAYDEARRTVVEVSDQGEGIPEELKKQIFEPFFSTKKDSGHHGLGLSLARAVFEAQGAEFHMDSAPGKGTHILIKFTKVGEATEGERLVAPKAPASVIPSAPDRELSFIEDAEEPAEDWESMESIPKLARKLDELPVEIRQPKETSE